MSRYRDMFRCPRCRAYLDSYREWTDAGRVHAIGDCPHCGRLVCPAEKP